MQQLSAQDASFIYMDLPNSPMHIGALAVYDPATAPNGFVRFKDILRTLAGRLPLARSFRERVVRVPFDLDHPYWVRDASFDLEFHVRHIALPQPRDWRQLCIQVARLHARPLDLSRPLWEMTVIEGLDNVRGLPRGAFAIVSKIHHAAVDGVSGAEITHVIHDLSPTDAAVPAPDDWQPDREPSVPELLIRTHLNNLRQPWRAAQVLMHSARPMMRLSAGFLRHELHTIGSVPPTRFNGVVSPHRVVEGVSLELDAIRALGKSLEGATVNDAILAIVGGALRRYLRAKNELPTIPLVAMAPISVRSERQGKDLGNRVSAMLVALGTHIDDGAERLEAIRNGTRESKKLTEAIGADALTEYSQLVPAAFAGLAARLYTRMHLANATSPMFNVVVTNVPGPRQPLYLGGARLVTQYGLGPVFDAMGLIIPVFSYCGKITVSFSACRDMVPDPAFLAECFHASYEELEASVQRRQSA